jgi:hypothetical protein
MGSQRVFDFTASTINKSLLSQRIAGRCRSGHAILMEFETRCSRGGSQRGPGRHCSTLPPAAEVSAILPKYAAQLCHMALVSISS